MAAGATSNRDRNLMRRMKVDLWSGH
jgi:hypothetical protein